MQDVNNTGSWEKEYMGTLYFLYNFSVKLKLPWKTKSINLKKNFRKRKTKGKLWFALVNTLNTKFQLHYSSWQPTTGGLLSFYSKKRLAAFLFAPSLLNNNNKMTGQV